MGFIVRRCVRCDITAQLDAQSLTWNKDGLNAEIFFVCSACDQSSVYRGQPQGRLHDLHGDLDNTGRHFDRTPIFTFPRTEKLSDDIPSRVRDIFRQAAVSRKLGLNDASGAMFRKAIDVATKLIYAHDARLSSKQPANAARSRIEALRNLGVIDDEIWELADVALMDGNDAAHDEDPYNEKEAEALEELTIDLLDRLFVKPARIARVREKQIEAGVRKL